MKKCNCCDEYKELADFHINPTNKDGHSGKCKKCTLDYNKARYWKNPVKYRKVAVDKHNKRKSQGLCLNCAKSGDYRKGYCESCFNMRLLAHKKRTVVNRNNVISHYGGACVCCGESEIKFLTLDHINNNGSSHRKEINRAQFYPWVIKNGYPKDLQVLCWNCNLGKYHNGGICPHKERESL